MGFAFLEVTGNRLVVYLNPSTIAQRTLAQLVYALADWNGRAIVGRIFVSDWKTQVLGDPLRAAKLIGRMVGEAQRNKDRRFKRRPLEMFIPDEFHPIIAAAQCVQISGALNYAALKGLEKAANGRFAVIERKPSDAEFYFREIGEGLELKRWMPGGQRHPASSHPDRDYGNWVAAHYSAALRSRQTQVELLDISFELPARGRMDQAYIRILAPVDTHTLLSTSITCDDKILRGVEVCAEVR